MKLTVLFIIIAMVLIIKINNPDKQEINNYSDIIKVDSVIGFDWEKNRSITVSMQDSLFISGSKWYNKSNHTLKPYHISGYKSLKWIYPAGKEYGYNRDVDKVRIWHNNQLNENANNLTEEDVREIINQELNY